MIKENMEAFATLPIPIPKREGAGPRCISMRDFKLAAHKLISELVVGREGRDRGKLALI